MQRVINADLKQYIHKISAASGFNNVLSSSRFHWRPFKLIFCTLYHQRLKSSTMSEKNLENNCIKMHDPLFKINPFQWQRHSSKNCWQLSWLMSLRHRANSCISKTEDPCSVHKQRIFGSKNDPSSWKMKKKTFENFPDLFPGEINLVPPKTYTPITFSIKSPLNRFLWS